MKKLFLRSAALLISALMLSTPAFAAKNWVDDVTVEATKGTAVIDGKYTASEWAGAKEISVTLDDPIVKAYGEYQGTWASTRNAADFSGSMYFMWDDTALYICEVRKDDSVDLGGTGQMPWGGGDGNLVFIQTVDGGTEGNKDAWAHHVFYIVGDGKASGKYSGDAWVRVCNGSTGQQETKKFDGIDIAASAIDGGFCVEVKVPWAVFGEKIPSFKPAEGVKLGMSMVPIDNDADGSNAQLSWVKQADKLGVTHGYDFGGWATMVLAAAPVIEDNTAPQTADTTSLALAALAASLAIGFTVIKTGKH